LWVLLCHYGLDLVAPSLLQNYCLCQPTVVLKVEIWQQLKFALEKAGGTTVNTPHLFWPIRCHSVLAGWINYTEIHFNFIFSYDASSIKDGVCCIMGLYFKGCNPHWARLVFVFFLTLDCKIFTSLRWYWKQAIEIIIALLTVCSSCSLFYVTSTLQNILWIKQPTHVLGMFSKLQEVAISFVMCVHPSVHMEQLDSHWMNLMKFDIWGVIKNLLRKFSVIKVWQE